MSHLILVRHGQSEWNFQKRFTGWGDIDLTAQGKLEAVKAGELIKEKKVKIDFFYSSLQKRAVNTLKLILNTLRIKDEKIIKAWEFNERHYGALTGLNKDEMKKIYGDKKILEFRRSWNISPEPLNRNNPYHPINIEVYNNIPRDKIPDTESLKNTYDRVVKYFESNVLPILKKNNNILISAHGNSLRGLCKFLFEIDDVKISKLEIPTGNPLVINFNEKTEILDASYLDRSRAKDLVVF
ncbi:MAG: phosphoglyceromutase [Candidatus Pelagibacter sp.]|nr:phosphoglyceromutase [Candidatus Pelagibacter sp.]